MMRHFARLATLLLLLAACQLHAPAPGDVSPLGTDEIAVTPLERAPVAAVPSVPTPATPQQSTPAAAAPQPETSSPEQALCKKSKGQWSSMAESSGQVCVHPTRDAGKSCRRKGDCTGECLAESGTCSPITPLMGCNAILQADGTEVTLCLQ